MYLPHCPQPRPSSTDALRRVSLPPPLSHLAFPGSFPAISSVEQLAVLRSKLHEDTTI